MKTKKDIKPKDVDIGYRLIKDEGCTTIQKTLIFDENDENVYATLDEAKQQAWDYLGEAFRKLTDAWVRVTNLTEENVDVEAKAELAELKTEHQKYVAEDVIHRNVWRQSRRGYWRY